MQRFSAILVLGLASLSASACKRPEPAHADSPSSARVAAIEPDVTPVPPAPAPTPKNVELRGHVRWSNGAPASGAKLEIHVAPSAGNKDARARTTFVNLDDGAFAVMVEPGEYEVGASIDRPAGDPEQGPQREFAAPSVAWLSAPSVTVRAPRADVEIVFDAGRPVVVTVQDERGNAVPDASVKAWCSKRPAAAALSAPVRETRVGWRALHPGGWLLRAAAPGFAPSSLESRVFDGKAERVELVLRRSASLSGRVVDANGVGVADALIRPDYVRSWKIRGEHPGTLTDVSGGFVLDDVLPEAVVLVVKLGAQERNCTQSMNLASGEQRRDLVVTCSSR